MTADACFECDDARVTLFYPHVESAILHNATLFGDLSVGGWYQTQCPYCTEGYGDEPKTDFFLILPGGQGGP